MIQIVIFLCIALFIGFKIYSNKSYNNVFYLYICTYVYRNKTTGKVIKKHFVRYNKHLKRFEFLNRVNREDWEWGCVYNNIWNDAFLYGSAAHQIYDFQEYNGDVFIDKKVLDEYLSLEKDLHENQELKINRVV